MKRSALVYSITRGVARFVFSLFYRLEIRWKERFPDQGPAIILPKHQYWTDIPIVSLCFRSLLYFVAKRELFRYPLIRHYLYLLGGLPVDRKRSVRTLGSFKDLLRLLRRGERIVIFPEGTYVRGMVGSGKGRLLQMILGAQEDLGCRIPFIPVGIRYGGRKGWRREVQIAIGHALYAEKESDAPSLTHRVMNEIRRLSNMPR